MRLYWGVGIAFLGFMGMSWITGNLLHLEGRDLWMLRGFLAAIGISGITIFYALYGKGEAKLQQLKGGGQAGGAGAGGGGTAAPGGAADEVDLLVRDAEARLAASRLAQDAKIANLPAVFLIGESGTAKTCTMLNCGLEPELLAGQVYQENAIAATRGANLWFARQSIFVEAGGKLLGEPARWIRLIKKLQPGKLKSVVGGAGQAPRAALLCFDAEVFTRPGASESINIVARNLQARLGEISQTFGINFPVYVLFTRTDRIPFFADYVRNLTNEESTQVVGATLPIRPPQSTGVYAEEETRRINGAFNELFYSLCDKRIDFLPRENDPDKVPGAYEFPREFRKLRTPVVQFLVDVCRPSQLRASPFLRGFYFSGVRPVIVNEMASSSGMPRPAGPAYEAGGGATRIFKVGGGQQQDMPAFAQAPSAGARKVPQWVFLSHLFNDVILQDRTAMGASASSTKTSTLRRVLLLAGAALCLLLIAFFTTSYFGNRSLENTAITAAQAVPALDALNLPTRDSLEKLEALRQTLDQLTIWERDGAPLRLRWFLYAGSDMYPYVRQAYYNKFAQLMFRQTQAGLVDWCKRLPAKPGANDDYQYTYDTLKAYLITTSEYKRSTRAFLSPVMMSRWLGNQQLDAERAGLARKQWDFYADDLKSANPYDTTGDGQAIDRARRYLAEFGGIERVYQFMLAEASNSNPRVNFNAMFPGSAEVVLNNRDVAGAFTKKGWAFMQEALKKSDKYFGGEQWVLGDYKGSSVDPGKLEEELRSRYTSDYIAKWREYLRNSMVVRYANLRDAANKLNKTSSNQSPLLELFWLCSNHTNVDSQKVKDAFDAVQKVVPPTDLTQMQFVGPTNNAYIGSLVTLQTSLDQAANQQPGPDPQTANATLQNATNAHVATKQVANTFRIDPEANVHGMTQKLMEDPITHAEALLRGLGPAELNAKAKGFCQEFNLLGNKYPFNSTATQEATLQEVDGIFRPQQGKLWVFYETSLKNSLQKAGANYVANPSAPVKLTEPFVTFFNRAAVFGEALYREGAGPKITYSLTPLPSEGVKARTVRIDGQVVQAGEQGGAGKPFVWPGAGVQEAKLAVGLGGPEFESYAFGGLWAAFKLFGEAEHWQQAGAGYNMEWQLRTGTQVMKLPSGAPLVVRFFVDLKGAPAFFMRGYFAQMKCTPNAAR